MPQPSSERRPSQGRGRAIGRVHNQITTVTAKKQLLYVPADQGATPVRGNFLLFHSSFYLKNIYRDLPPLDSFNDHISLDPQDKSLCVFTIVKKKLYFHGIIEIRSSEIFPSKLRFQQTRISRIP
jgi:hypothetical protein